MPTLTGTEITVNRAVGVFVFTKSESEKFNQVIDRIYEMLKTDKFGIMFKTSDNVLIKNVAYYSNIINHCLENTFSVHLALKNEDGKKDMLINFTN